MKPLLQLTNLPQKRFKLYRMRGSRGAQLRSLISCFELMTILLAPKECIPEACLAF